MIYEMFGWVALGLNIWGNLGLAKKSISGWLIRLACNVAFVIYSAAFGVWPLLANHIIFAGVNIYGWREWKNDSLRYTCGCGREWFLTGKHPNNCICESPIPLTNEATKHTEPSQEG